MIRTRLIVIVGLLVMLLSSAAAVIPTQAAQTSSAAASSVKATTIRGYLVSEPVTTTLPVTLSIQTPRNGVITVTVSSTTKVIRRYNGVSSVAELSANDVLEVTGTMTGPQMFNATVVRDISLQAARANLIGVVTAVTPNSVSVVVQKDETGVSPFSFSQNLTLPVGPSTRVVSGTTVMTGVTSLVSVGTRVAALGIFNKVSNSFESIFYIRELGPKGAVSPLQVGVLAPVYGYLVAAPVTVTRPVVLQFQTPFHGLISVTVTSSTRIVRRFMGASGLDELSANDILEITGMATSATALNATLIRDVSLQAAYARVVGQVTALTPNSITLVTQADTTAKSIIPGGYKLTLVIAPSTEVIYGTKMVTGTTSPLTVGSRVTAIGIYNRISRSFTEVDRIRVI